ERRFAQKHGIAHRGKDVPLSVTATFFVGNHWRGALRRPRRWRGQVHAPANHKRLTVPRGTEQFVWISKLFQIGLEVIGARRRFLGYVKIAAVSMADMQEVFLRLVHRNVDFARRTGATGEYA